MEVNSTGDKNRISGRDFNENNIQIDQFDGRHTVNIAIPSDKRDERPLVKAQRKTLNSLVITIASSCRDEAYVIWQKVHAEIGVSSIDEMTVNQYQTAISFLQAMVERNRDKDASRILVSLLLRNSEDSELRQRLIRYCHVNFGTGRLNDLTRPQLQMTLSWLDQQSQAPPESIPPVTSKRLNVLELLHAYPIEIIFIFVVGVLAGVSIF